ncbi:LysR family transcriptional regulator (plasmid) [Bradyrhizobium sp. 62B]|uniref:LysR family transcriptional regulator n=1 Tax=Bradyrhizobium sp. 62B TaxID=2898442 RepID=UPI002558094C|nr:LysR family transcriptional regulator [Bradyrhizobium sp. 62B]
MPPIDRLACQTQRPISNPISLQHLRVAVTVHESGSIRSAAKVLGIEHSAVSRALGRLECLAGAPLFERSRYGMNPTASGTIFLRTAKLIIEQVDSLSKATVSTLSKRADHLAVGFCPFVSAGRIAPTIAEFQSRYPAIKVAVLERAMPKLLIALQMGSLDIAIAPEGLSSMLLTTSIPVWREGILIALTSNDKLAQNERVSSSDLKGRTVLISHEDPAREVEDILVCRLAACGNGAKIEACDVSRGKLTSLVSIGRGVTPLLASEAHAGFPGVVYRELHDASGPSRITVSAHVRTGDERPVVADFLALLRECYTSGGEERA